MTPAAVPASSPDLLALLTPAMAELCRSIGEAALLALLGKHGGGRLYIPEAVPIGGPLVTLVGVPAAAHLVAHHGREYMQLPLCKAWRVHMLSRTGLSQQAIAYQLGMHRVSVARILSAPARGQHAARRGGKPGGPGQMRFDV